MPPEKLVRMANQIATFFRSQKGIDQTKAVAGHLSDYWTKAMVQALGAYVAGGGTGLDPLARAALVEMGALAESAG
jgi:formate dehydrogenase subunit delta